MGAGDEIICFCGRCKLELRHVIVAHKSGNSGAIAKVRCNTCNTIHAYRGKPVEKTAGERKERVPRQKAQIIPVEVEWREQMNKSARTASIAYTPQREYKVGDVLDHPTFGSGVVRTIKEGNKFEVLFQRDVKILVHKLKAVSE